MRTAYLKTSLPIWGAVHLRTGRRWRRPMAAMGLNLQAISPMPELLSYWMDTADVQQLLRYLNEQIALMVAESGGHLVFVFGERQLMIGTDYPFNFHESASVKRIEAAGFDAATMELLIHRNAETFPGMTPREH